jgi:hypothetical protein
MIHPVNKTLNQELPGHIIAQQTCRVQNRGENKRFQGIYFL